jgi:hypothetical protein
MKQLFFSRINNFSSTSLNYFRGKSNNTWSSMLCFIFIVSFSNSKAQVPCSGAPSANTVTAIGAPVCTGATATVGLLNTYTVNGLTYQLVSSTVSPVGPWINLNLNFTGSFITPPQNINTWYSIVVTCTNGNISTNAVPFLATSLNNTFAISAPSICANQNATLTANSPVLVNWYNSPTSTTSIGSGSLYVTPSLAAGNYTYYAQATLPCTFTSVRMPANLTVNPEPTITISSGTLCTGKNYTINPSGAANYTISGGNFIVNPNSNTSYTINGTNTLGCQAAQVVCNVSVFPNPTVSAVGASICSNQTLNLTASSSNASSFSWTGPNAFSSNLQNPSIVSLLVNASGSYTVVATSALGCSNSAICNASITALPIYTPASNSPRCEGATLNLNVNVQSGVIFSWSGPNGFSSGLTNVNISNSSLSNGGTYTLIASKGSCIESKTIAVIINPLPIILAPGGFLCEGKSFMLNPQGASIYNYMPSGPLVMPATTTIYTITGTNLTTGCTNYTTTTLFVYALPVISLNTSKSFLCLNESSTITASGANSYTWSTGSNSSQIVVSPIVSTNYTVVGENTNSTCTNTAIINQSVDACLSIDNSSFKVQNSSLQIYPNPNNGEFTIETPAETELTIINALGQIILQQHLSEGNTKIDLNEQAKGIYFMKIKNSNFKIIKE